MFLAIINDAYEKVHEKVKESTKYTLGELIRKRVKDFRKWVHPDEKPPKPHISNDEIIRRLYAVSKDKNDLTKAELIEVLGDEIAADMVFGTQEKIRRKRTGRTDSSDVEMLEMVCAVACLRSCCSLGRVQWMIYPCT